MIIVTTEKLDTITIILSSSAVVGYDYDYRNHENPDYDYRYQCIFLITNMITTQQKGRTAPMKA